MKLGLNTDSLSVYYEMGQDARSNKLRGKDFKDKLSSPPISQTEGLLKKPRSKVWVPQVSLGEAYEI